MFLFLLNCLLWYMFRRNFNTNYVFFIIRYIRENTVEREGIPNINIILLCTLDINWNILEQCNNSKYQIIFIDFFIINISQIQNNFKLKKAKTSIIFESSEPLVFKLRILTLEHLHGVKYTPSEEYNYRHF